MKKGRIHHVRIEKTLKKKKNWTRSIKVCVENANRLLEESQHLKEWDYSLATPYFLSVISQEECAKGFLLHLVAKGVIPWNKNILRITRDHNCKHLLSIIVDHLSPDFEEMLARHKEQMKTGDFRLPSKVADSMNILKFEKVGRWGPVYSYGSTDWDEEAMKIANGKKDKRKQNSLYVLLGKDGSVGGTPKVITLKMYEEEYERAVRFIGFVNGLTLTESSTAIDYEKIVDGFQLLFSE